MANLLETYAKRLSVSDSVYKKAHNGQSLDNTKKLMVAACIDNVSRYLTEAFDNSVGTQRSNLGMYKKFCLNLTTVTLPNLIAPEIVMVSPMTSMTGYKFA